MRLIILLITLLFLIGCTKIETTEKPINAISPETATPVIKEEPKEQPKEVIKSPEEICKENAVALIPQTFSLIIASSNNPNTSNWDLDKSAIWLDNTPMDSKGVITFYKGRLSSENTNYWYTGNTQNEKLFGTGGLKYYKKVTLSNGRIGNNEFIIKPILKPIKILQPQESFAPYTGTFKIIDYGFVSCNWTE